MNNKNMSATSNNKGLLETLPPIVPSIGFTKGQKNPTAADNNDTDTKNDNDTKDTSSNDINMLTAEETLSQPTTTNTKKLPPSIKLGNRLILTSKTPRQWSWSSFTSSARKDTAIFHHWVRSNVEYADYPYARFDISLDPLVYTDEEYTKYLQMDSVDELEGVWDLVTGERIMQKEEEEDNKSNEQTSSLQSELSINNKVLPWTKSETDALLELARSCDLRWPVIIDRWHTRFAKSPTRQIQDLQHRYYQVGSILAQRRAEKVMGVEVAKLDTSIAANPQSSTSAATQPQVTSQQGQVVASSSTETLVTGNASSSTTVVPSLPSAPRSSTDAAVKQPTVPVSSSNTTLMLPPQPKLPAAEIDALQKSHAQTSTQPSLAPPMSLPATGTAHQPGTKTFDLAAERARRAQLDRAWHRTKEEEREEEELRAELRLVEAQLRKLKRSGKHLVPAGSAMAAPPPSTSIPVVAEGSTKRAQLTLHPPSRRGQHASAAAQHPPPPLPGRTIVDPCMQTHQSVSASFVDTAPVPTPGTPYLQSARLFPPSVESCTSLNKSTLKQMNAILEELSVPAKPIPTKRNCDLYDGVRKDALTLLILQKMVLRKESELATKKAKLLEAKTIGVGGSESTTTAEVQLEDVRERKNSMNETTKSPPKAKSKKGGTKAKKRTAAEISSSAPPPSSVPAPAAPPQPPKQPVTTQPTKTAEPIVTTSSTSSVAPPPVKVAEKKVAAKQPPKKRGRGRPRKDAS